MIDGHTLRRVRAVSAHDLGRRAGDVPPGCSRQHEDGKIVEVNDEVKDSPEKVNEDTYGDGWLLKIEISDTAQLDSLMDSAGYDSLIAE